MGGRRFSLTSEDIVKFAWAFHNGEIHNDFTKELFTKPGILNNGCTFLYGKNNVIVYYGTSHFN